ncbi:phage holin family protein [Sutcliffiella horikoshii]|uniref:Phage holin family protein n=1 Tax=Sutcliffiella horikoshii TaxID=79883 RepID=A0A5D4THD7_9BACI|nr:phage holin family protein [Sutcliffiella horikoshii]TYS74529.1 phage holin family protein [Sutcliffiella horikoshii]
MEKLAIIYNGMTLGIGACVGFLYGGASGLLIALVTLAAFDYLTGLLASGYEGKLNSKVGFRGIAKKVMMFTLVAVAHQLDLIIGDSGVFMDMVIFFYLGNELLSILENAGRTGLPIPDQLKKAIQVLKGKSGEPQKEEDK